MTRAWNFCPRQSSFSTNSSGFKPQQLYRCTVCTSDSIYWPVGCFTHDLMWQAHQLVHAGDDSASSKSAGDDTEKLRDEKVECVSALPKELLGTYNVYLLPFHDERLNRRGDHSLSCAMLDDKKQMLWSLLSSLLGESFQDLRAVVLMRYLTKNGDSCLQNLGQTPEQGTDRGCCLNILGVTIATQPTLIQHCVRMLQAHTCITIWCATTHDHKTYVAYDCTTHQMTASLPMMNCL